MILLKPFKANILSSLAISWSVFTYLLVMAYIFLLFSMSKVFFFFWFVSVCFLDARRCGYECCWVPGFCWLPLKRIGVCFAKLLSYLMISLILSSLIFKIC